MTDNKIKVYQIGKTSNDSTDLFDFVDNVQDCDFIYFSLRTKVKQDKITEITETNIPAVVEVLNLVNKYNKYLLYFCSGDVPPIILPHRKDVFVYKTSLDSSRLQNNEYIMGVGVNDAFNSRYIEEPKLTIGFVGQTAHGRLKYLEYLEKSNIETDFIKRDMDFTRFKESKRKAIMKEFYDNMERNIFIFCYRGRGNFSVRFYETLMMGRIPIVINTNCIYPFTDLIDYNNVGLFIEENDLNKEMNLEQRILDYYEKNKNNLLEIQKNNRKIYEEYFSKKQMYYVFKEVKERIEKLTNKLYI